MTTNRDADSGERIAAVRRFNRFYTQHIGVLREEFMDFCDHLNLDAIFEPVKS